MPPLKSERPPLPAEQWPINLFASLPGEPLQNSTGAPGSQAEPTAGGWLIAAIGEAGLSNPALGRWLARLAIMEIAA